MQQMSLFDLVFEQFKINKKIRLIEFFAGIGSQAKALKNLGANFEHWKTCEWAIPSILAYASIHRDELPYYGDNFCGDLSKEQICYELYKFGVSANYNEPATLEQLKRMPEDKIRLTYNSLMWMNNLVDISRVKGRELMIIDTKDNTYLLTYSFPCQDLSLAGLQKGMKKGESTRSGLLWQVERILEECKKEGELPQVLLMENVPQVIGEQNIKDFQDWVTKLETLGYSNFVDVLNAKDYEIPQNRQRCFMVSILGEWSYHFPYKKELKLRLKDVLEKEVDEKYYLSNKMINYISATNDKWTGNNGGAIVNKQIASTLNTGEGSKRCDASNYIAEGLEDNTDLRVMKCGNYMPSGHNVSSIIDPKGISPTVMGNHGTVTAVVDGGDK